MNYGWKKWCPGWESNSAPVLKTRKLLILRALRTLGPLQPPESRTVSVHIALSRLRAVHAIKTPRDLFLSRILSLNANWTAGGTAKHMIVYMVWIGAGF